MIAQEKKKKASRLCGRDRVGVHKSVRLARARQTHFGDIEIFFQGRAWRDSPQTRSEAPPPLRNFSDQKIFPEPAKS
jgi:hypothetical protein